MKNLNHKEMIERFAEIGGMAYGNKVKLDILNTNNYIADDDEVEEHFVIYNEQGISKITDDNFNFLGFSVITYDITSQSYDETTEPIQFDHACILVFAGDFAFNLSKQILKPDLQTPFIGVQIQPQEVLAKIIQFPGAKK